MIRLKGCSGGKIVVKKCEQFRQLLGEVRSFVPLAAFTLQSKSFQAAASGRAPKAEIDPAWIQRVQHPEFFHNFQRAVMREQHPAGTDAYSGSFSGHSRDENFRRGAGERFNGVVLGDPIAFVAEAVGCARQVDRIVQRVGWREPRGHGRLVEEGEFHYSISFPPSPRKPKKLSFRGTLCAEESLFS